MFSPCGELVATASADCNICVWNAITGGCKHTLVGHTGNINNLVFTKDSQVLLSISNDSSCRVWGVNEGWCIALLSGHTKAVTCLDYSPDSDRLVTGSKDKTLILWNLRNAATVKTLRGHTAGCLAVAISADGRKVFSSGRDKFVRVWTVSDIQHKDWEPKHGYGPMDESQKLHRKVKFPGVKCTSMLIEPGNRYIAMAYDDGLIEFLKVDNYVVDHVEQAHSSDISGMDFAKDGSMLASCGYDRIVVVYSLEYYSNSPRSQMIWKEKAGVIKEMKLLHKFELWPGVEQILHGVIFNGTDTELVVACEDAIGYVIDISKEKITKKLQGHAFRITCLAYHSDGIWLALGSYDKSVTIWHGESGLLRSKITAFAGAVLCVGFLPFGPFLCVGAVDKSTKVFHVLTGEMQFSLSAHSLAVRQMSISADGVIATASDDKEVRCKAPILSLRRPLPVAYVTRASCRAERMWGTGQNLLFSLKQSRLQTETLKTEQVRLWDCRMPWNEVMGTQLAVCRGHQGAITCCHLTKEGKGLLSASEDKKMIIWDVVHGAIMRILVGHTQPVRFPDLVGSLSMYLCEAGRFSRAF